MRPSHTLARQGRGRLLETEEDSETGVCATDVIIVIAGTVGTVSACVRWLTMGIDDRLYGSARAAWCQLSYWGTRDIEEFFAEFGFWGFMVDSTAMHPHR